MKKGKFKIIILEDHYKNLFEYDSEMKEGFTATYDLPKLPSLDPARLTLIITWNKEEK